MVLIVIVGLASVSVGILVGVILGSRGRERANSEALQIGLRLGRERGRREADNIARISQAFGVRLGVLLD